MTKNLQNKDIKVKLKEKVWESTSASVVPAAVVHVIDDAADVAGPYHADDINIIMPELYLLGLVRRKLDVAGNQVSFTLSPKIPNQFHRHDDDRDQNLSYPPVFTSNSAY